MLKTGKYVANPGASATRLTDLVKRKSDAEPYDILMEFNSEEDFMKYEDDLLRK